MQRRLEAYQPKLQELLDEKINSCTGINDDHDINAALALAFMIHITEALLRMQQILQQNTHLKQSLENHFISISSAFQIEDSLEASEDEIVIAIFEKIKTINFEELLQEFDKNNSPFLMSSIWLIIVLLLLALPLTLMALHTCYIGSTISFFTIAARHGRLKAEARSPR